MRKILLHSPVDDRRGKYRDAGETLIVGADDSADIDAARAGELVDGGRAIVLDPLDHDGDGLKGGAVPAKGGK